MAAALFKSMREAAPNYVTRATPSDASRRRPALLRAGQEETAMRKWRPHAKIKIWEDFIMTMRNVVLFTMLAASLGGCATTTASGPSANASLSPKAAVEEHIRALTAKDLQAVMDGYAEDAVILVAPNPVVGKPAIKAVFEAVMKGPPQPDPVVETIVCSGDSCLVSYHLGAMRGADTVVVRGGKITMQSVYIVSQ
jgi:SnoaL-like domain